MPLSSLNRRSIRTALVTTLVMAAGACSDQSITGGAKPVQEPTVNPSQAGMLRGTVREDGTIYFESLDPSIQVGDNGVSGAIYGNQNVTARVSISAYHMDSNSTTKTWTLKLAVHNLLNFPVGSVDGSAAPYDTVGVFVFFPSTPRILTPVPCQGCGTISILNTQGSANFTAPNQSYYYYHDRLAAKGQAGDSTRSNPTWTFRGSRNIKSFSFFVILSAPWPRGVAGGDTTWSVFFNPVVDSLPDANAKPRWKTIGVNFGGTYSAATGALKLDANHGSASNDFFCALWGYCNGASQDLFFYRADNLNRSENAFIEAQLLVSGGGSNPIAILALADSVKFVGLGIGSGKIGFATFNTSTLKWEWLAGGTWGMNTTKMHKYRVGKFGATIATVYVDGVELFSQTNLPDNFLPAYSSTVGPQAAKLSSFFGITSQDVHATATINYVTYAFHATPAP